MEVIVKMDLIIIFDNLGYPIIVIPNPDLSSFPSVTLPSTLRLNAAAPSNAPTLVYKSAMSLLGTQTAAAISRIPRELVLASLIHTTSAAQGQGGNGSRDRKGKAPEMREYMLLRHDQN